MRGASTSSLNYADALLSVRLFLTSSKTVLDYLLRIPFPGINYRIKNRFKCKCKGIIVIYSRRPRSKALKIYPQLKSFFLRLIFFARKWIKLWLTIDRSYLVSKLAGDGRPSTDRWEPSTSDRAMGLFVISWYLGPQLPRLVSWRRDINFRWAGTSMKKSRGRNNNKCTILQSYDAPLSIRKGCNCRSTVDVGRIKFRIILVSLD